MSWLAVVAPGLSVLALATGHAKRNDMTHTLATGNNAFAFALYDRLAHEPGNVFFSPFSVHGALAMVYAGSRGGTATSIAKTMHYPAEPAALGAAYRPLLDAMHAPGGGNCRASQLEIANALWTNDRVRFEPAFVTGVERDFGGMARALDVAHPQRAATLINGWVLEQTHQRIRDLVPASALTAQTASVLTNAIYFHGWWATPFKKTRTHQALFYRSPHDTVDIPTMRLDAKLDYAETADVQVLSMPYADERLSMLIVLPRRRAAVSVI